MRLILFLILITLSAFSFANEFHYKRSSVLVGTIEALHENLNNREKTQKYCILQTNPMLFFRGTAYFFYEYFKGHEAFNEENSGKYSHIWIHGNPHANNFELTLDNDGHIVYELANYHSSMVADFRFDVMRLVIDTMLLADKLQMSEEEKYEVVNHIIDTYIKKVQSFRGNQFEIAHSMFEHNSTGLLKDLITDTKNNKSKEKILNFLVEDEEFREHDFFRHVEGHVESSIRLNMEFYTLTTDGKINKPFNYFKVKDIREYLRKQICRIGLTTYYVLIEGDTDAPEDDRILILYEEVLPEGYRHLPNQLKRQVFGFSNQSLRSLTAQKIMTAEPDNHLGFIQVDRGNVHNSYTVMELSPYTDVFKVNKILDVDDFKDIGGQWASVLATAHARADEDRKSSMVTFSFEKEFDLMLKSKYKDNKFGKHIIRLSEEYIEFMMKDYKYFTHYMEKNKDIVCH